MKALFCFGFGYSARALGRRLAAKGWRVQGTSTTPEGVARLGGMGFEGVLFDGDAPSPGAREALREATHVLLSAPPGEHGDPVLRHHGDDLAAARAVEWIGYFSTIGVYGDQDGGWVDETSKRHATSERGRRRIESERSWEEFGEKSGAPIQIFRLAGIYGPGRSAIDSLRAGVARTIVKPGQVFNRIHVEDIAATLEAAIERAGGSAMFNVTDDEPAPPQDVMAYAAKLLGVPPPPEIPFSGAEMSEMARSFYSENKRVANRRIKADLGVRLLFPTYREGLAAIAERHAEVHL